MAGAKFAMKNPMDMAARILSSPRTLQIPVEMKSPPRAKERTRPSSCITFLMIFETNKPTILPTRIDPKISLRIPTIWSPNEMDSPPKRGFTRVDATAYRTRATASSIATIPRIVVVRGPRVLYSFRTSVVAAGAVAEQIAPRTSP